MPLPDLDPEQRRAALAKAGDARRERAEIKRSLKAGETSLAVVLEAAAGSDALAKMRVSEVLEALPAVGPIKAERLMEELRIARSRRIRGLGPRQRQALLDAFPQRP